MKIAYIFAYLGDGGAEDHALLLAQSARKAGNDAFFIVSSHSDSASKRLRAAGFEMVRLPMESSFNPVTVIKSALKLKKTIANYKIDIVHSHMLREQSLGVAAKILGAKFKLIRTFHRFDQFNLKMRPLMLLYSKFTDAVIAISPKMVQYLKSNGLVKKVSLINNGVGSVKVKSHEKALGFIGRLTDEKGILQFIQANTDILRRTKLVVAGDGPNRAAIKTIVDDKKLNVEMMGQVENKADFYSKVSVLVLPSRSEVMPLVVLEAYSCGLPVTGFKIDALVDLVGPANGKLAECQNYEDLGRMAVKLLGMLQDYRQANQALYDAKYSATKMWSQTNTLYEKLLNE